MCRHNTGSCLEFDAFCASVIPGSVLNGITNKLKMVRYKDQNVGKKRMKCIQKAWRTTLSAPELPKHLAAWKQNIDEEWGAAQDFYERCNTLVTSLTNTRIVESGYSDSDSFAECLWDQTTMISEHEQKNEQVNCAGTKLVPNSESLLWSIFHCSRSIVLS